MVILNMAELSIAGFNIIARLGLGTRGEAWQDCTWPGQS